MKHQKRQPRLPKVVFYDHVLPQRIPVSRVEMLESEPQDPIGRMYECARLQPPSSQCCDTAAEHTKIVRSSLSSIELRIGMGRYIRRTLRTLWYASTSHITTHPSHRNQHHLHKLHYIPRIDHYLLHTRCHRAPIRTHHANHTSAVTCSPKPHPLPLLPPRTNKASQQTSNQWLVVVSEKAWNDSRKSSNEGLTARSLLLKCELTIHHGSRLHLRTPWPSTGICRIHTIDEGREFGRFLC
jgi:hypothetical protein